MSAELLSRRTLLAGGATALTAPAERRIIGANDRVGVGFIGYGLIGKRHVVSFKQLSDVDIVAVSDTHAGRLAEAASFIGGAVKPYADFRRLLEDPAVDAVVISTPDHWHALMTMLACAAGKDVYVEKPLTLFVQEGEWMLSVARKHRSIVQVGTQQRSGAHYARARDLIRSGELGKVTSVRMGAARNIMPGFGRPADCEPPAELNWDLWLGPAPARAYNPNRGIYHFRWFWDYSGGQMTNLGQHSLDIVEWVLGTQGLQSVYSNGGRFALTDNGETPDTQDAHFQFPGWSAAWMHREAARGETRIPSLEFCGTRGSLTIDRAGFKLSGDPDLAPENFIPQFTGPHPVGGPRRTPPPAQVNPRTPSRTDESGSSDGQFVAHARNFIDCIRSRATPVSDLASAHRVATLCHLANLSLRLGRQLHWDPEHATLVGDPEAASMLRRPYRAPWDRELTALGVG